MIILTNEIKAQIKQGNMPLDCFVTQCNNCAKRLESWNSYLLSLAEKDNYPGKDEKGIKRDLGAPYALICYACFSRYWE